VKSVVLLSGGLDSTVSLAQALRETEVSLALTFDYGQRSAAREIMAAKKIAGYYGICHQVLALSFLKDVTGTALVRENQAIPEPLVSDLDVHEQALSNAVRVWVPNRNGLFINVAAVFAEARQCGIIVTGFNREEAKTFPDNSFAFVQAANNALAYSTLNQVKVVSYTQQLDKEEIVQLGRRLKVPLEHIWSCYLGGEEMCGRCESCRRFSRALQSPGRC
jgi:7-cyano-7-deazaguanine synthase